MKQEDIDKWYTSCEGTLQKYTNVMKGWCPRWFRLDPASATLDYYLSCSEVHKAPRGTLDLRGAVVSPSEEDSHTFVLSSTSGEAFKLRASDAKERQEWVNRLRAVSEQASNQADKATSRMRPIGLGSPWDNYSVFMPATNPTKSVQDWANAHSEADNQLKLIGDLLDKISKETDQLPNSGVVTTHSKELMELASTSLMTLHTLQDAIRLLENEAYKPKPPD